MHPAPGAMIGVQYTAQSAPALVFVGDVRGLRCRKRNSRLIRPSAREFDNLQKRSATLLRRRQRRSCAGKPISLAHDAGFAARLSRVAICAG